VSKAQSPYVEEMTTRLTVTAKGQVTLRKELLDHLGVRPGDRVVVELAPEHTARIRAAPTGRIDDFIGCLPSRGVTASVSDMNEAIASGWAGACE